MLFMIRDRGLRVCVSALLVGSVGLTALFPIAPAATAAGPLTGRTIVLNPEEGGSESGGISGGIEEKNINLPTTLDVGALLTQAGANVVYTRRTDVSVSLAARSALANQVHADAFITIAANALNDPSYSGVMTFYGSSGGYVGRQTRSANLVAASRDLAGDVQSAVQQATGEVDRGVKSANFYVLGYSQMPAILIETGFMTNPRELQKLITPSYQETIAAGIASGVEQFLGGLGGAPAPTGAVPTATTAAADGSYVSDVTFPDHSVVSPGETVTKTWQVTNTGEIAWDSTDSLVLQAGGALQAAASVPLPNVAPGQTADLSVPITVPNAPGSYFGTFRLTTAAGQAFGDPLWVNLAVPGAAFSPFWVETTQPASIWSAADPSGTAVLALGQWTYLQITGPQTAGRLPVTEPESNKQGYVDASVVGPSGPPPTGYAPPPVQPPFAPFWVETTRATPLYSAASDPSATFGTLAQWSSLLVLTPQRSLRFYVRNPATGGTAYVNAAAVGPSGPPSASSSAGSTPAAPATPPPAPVATVAYVVKIGDTLSSISQAFAVSASAIAQANNLANPNDIVVGRTLQIPGGVLTFQPFWVENFAKTALWSGSDSNAKQLGVAAQFTPLHVLAPPANGRYLVRVWTTGGQAYVDTAVVGPTGAPKGE